MWLSRRACYCSKLSKWGKLGEQSIVENYNCLPNQLPFRRIVKPITLAIGSLASANTPKSLFSFQECGSKTSLKLLRLLSFLWLFATLSLAKLSFKTVERVENRWQVGVLHTTDNARHCAQQRQTAKWSFGMALCAKYTFYRCANPLMKKLVLPFFVCLYYYTIRKE